ncbi:MAG: hypothetical protein QXG18_01525 [Candidatus Pacearchaeota archaeon]
MGLKKKVIIINLIFFYILTIYFSSSLDIPITTRLNNMEENFFMITSNDCSSSPFDYKDFRAPFVVDDYSILFSRVNNINLSVDCWNPEIDPRRNITLIYKVFSPANYTGNLFFYWNPGHFSGGSFRLNMFLVDVLTNQRINLSSQSSASFFNNQEEREFRLESHYEWCGDGIVNLNEECDTENLNGQTCASIGRGFSGGILGCNQNCLFDTSSCTGGGGPGGGTNGRCGTTLNNCSAGIFEDIPDNSTHFLWRCLGNGGGTTASCSLNKNLFCNNQCLVGQRECVTNNSYRVCGDFNNDGCFEWGVEERCLNINPICHQGFCYECRDNRDCQEGFCINNKCEKNCNKTCKELDLECGVYFFCENILDCGSCKNESFCNNEGKCFLPEKIKNDSCESEYVCTDWSECKLNIDFEPIILGNEWFSGKRERICFDKKNCRQTIKEQEECVIKREIFTRNVTICDEIFIEIYDKNTNELITRIKDRKFTKKSLLEIFLFPKKNIECEPGREPYKLSWFDKLMTALDLRKMWNLIK